MSDAVTGKPHDGQLADVGEHPLDELQLLLDRQADLMRQGRLTEVETLAEQAGRLVERLRGQELPETGKAAVENSYRGLSLMLAAECNDVHRELKHLRHVRRTIGAYRGRIERP
jgi:hypothetical protein